jgi:hypothetical protein
MMNQSKIILTSIVCSACAFFGSGCGGEEETKASPVVQAPSKAPPTLAKSVEKIVESLSIDPRIHLDEKEAPRSESQRIAILTFFDAMLRADAEALKSKLSFNDQLELDAMVNNGLASSMDDVSLVILLTGESPEGKPCVMAIYETDYETEMDYQVQLWYIENSGKDSTFVAVETPPNLVEKLSGNWIENYFVWKGKQAKIAQQPDEEASYALAGESTSSSGNRGGGGGPSGPSGPSGPGGR